MTSLRRESMTRTLSFEAEPFQGYTEFDEFEGFDPEASDELEGEFWKRRRLARPTARRPPSRPRRRPRRGPAGRRRPNFFATLPSRIPPANLNILAAPEDADAAGARPDGGYGDSSQAAPPFDAAAGDDAGGADAAADSGPSADGSAFDEGELDPEAFEMFYEWTEEVSRSSSEYIRWLQQSLNKILGLRLAVDGISGTQTRSAIRSFQQRAGITVDGIVGPQTEGALIKFGASPPPGYANTPTTPPSYGGGVPSYGGGVPSYGGGVPSYGGGVPSYGGGVPSFGGGSGFQFVQIQGIEKTSQAFRDKTANIANALKMDPNYLMAIMSFESSLNPQAVNSNTNATGLIQFMPTTATRLGTTVDALYRMNGEQQLDYVLKYFSPYKGKLSTLEDAYMAVLYPSAMGKGAAHVLFSSPSDAYRYNDVLDINHDGRITVAEATSFVRKKLPAGYKTGSGPVSGAPSSGVSPIGINTPLPSAGPGFYSYTTAAKRFGLSKTIQAILAVAAAWQQANPGGPRLGIGNISLQGGGPFPPHSSHQKGVDVDIRPVRNDRKEEPVTYQSASYLRALTQQLVDIIRANRVLSIRTILFNDPNVRGVSSYPGHDDHLHVSFNAA